MDLHVPPELEAKLSQLAAETGRNADQVALDLLTTSVDHDEWFRNTVEGGRASARDGRLLDHNAVASHIADCVNPISSDDAREQLEIAGREFESGSARE